MAKRKLTRAERYKRNYRIIKNAYQNTKLAKRSQTWSDQRIFNELGLKVSNKKTPEIKRITTKRQKSYYRRKLQKFRYGIKMGLTVVEAKRVTPYKRKKIDSISEYANSLRKDFNYDVQKEREALWIKWSSQDNKDNTRVVGIFPPEILQIAKETNEATVVGGKRLDPYDKYGFAVAYYLYVLDYDTDQIERALKPDPFDKYRVIYPTKTRAV